MNRFSRSLSQRKSAIVATDFELSGKHLGNVAMEIAERLLAVEKIKCLKARFVSMPIDVSTFSVQMLRPSSKTACFTSALKRVFSRPRISLTRA
jgi:hypothetical protein